MGHFSHWLSLPKFWFDWFDQRLWIQTRAGFSLHATSSCLHYSDFSILASGSCLHDLCSCLYEPSSCLHTLPHVYTTPSPVYTSPAPVYTPPVPAPVYSNPNTFEIEDLLISLAGYINAPPAYANSALACKPSLPPPYMPSPTDTPGASVDVLSHLSITLIQFGVTIKTKKIITQRYYHFDLYAFICIK